MNNEWEQEMYIDPKIEEMRKKNRELAGQWEEGRKREEVLVAVIVATFIARFLKLYLNADVLFFYVKICLIVVGLILYLIDLDELMRIGDDTQNFFLVFIWLFLRPFYFVMRAGVLQDDEANNRGIVYGITYFLVWMIYIGECLHW